MNHIEYMSKALCLAEKGRTSVSPNPMVGCVIVNQGEIVGEGFHQQAGGPHAEVAALRQAGDRAQGGTAYVSLEPCCHYGKTPPCTQALIEAGVARVYASCLDINPLVSGAGITKLREAGIQVETGLMESEARKLNEVFFHYILHKRPFVIAKWAMSLDGKTVTAPGDSREISSEESRFHSHQIRMQIDAILIGANTARIDNPLLTARHGTETSTPERQPLRIVLCGKTPLPLDLRVFEPGQSAQTLVIATPETDQSWIKALQQKSVGVLTIPANTHHHVDLQILLDELGRRQITSLLVEGGMAVHESFIRENLVNQFHVYLSPVVIGGLKNKRVLNQPLVTTLNNDLFILANIEDQHHV